jgi:hypothetical protein
MATSLPAKPVTELQAMLSFKRIDAISDVVRQAIKWGVLLGIARYGYLSIAALAGHQTLADIVVKLLANIKLSNGICYVVTGGSLIYGIGQRQLRRRNIRRIAHDKNEAERLIDPKRTSSNLTEKGTTRPGDKL